MALTGNWTILFAIEVVMALVAWSRYTTVRHSTIETSGPPQEVRHTCSGVCVPIIRAPAPPPRRIAFILHRSFLFFIYQNTRRTLYFVQRFRFAFRDTDASIFPAFLFQHIYFTTIFRKRDTPIVNCSTS